MTFRYAAALAFALLAPAAYSQSGYVLELSDGKLVDARSTQGIAPTNSESSSKARTSRAASAGSLHFRSCDEARRAGYSSMHAGTSGYREGLDGDADGIACEPYRGRR